MNQSSFGMVKLMLLGDSAVGKTCILRRFSDDQFDSSHILTIGIDFKTKVIESNGQRVKLQIWDTAGQERFRTILKQYYRGAMGILVIYDVTNAKSFNETERWLREIEDHASEDVLKILVGNKSDKANKRVVSRERGEMMALEYGMKFYETSAKLNVNIDKAIYELVDSILAQIRESPEDEPKQDTVVPGQWTSTGELLEKYRGGCC